MIFFLTSGPSSSGDSSMVLCYEHMAVQKKIAASYWRRSPPQKKISGLFRPVKYSDYIIYCADKNIYECDRETINVCIGKTNRKWDYPGHPTLISPLLDPKLSLPMFFRNRINVASNFSYQKCFSQLLVSFLISL